MTRRGKKRWKILDRVVFGKTDDPYLDRLRVVQTPWASIYLHKILRADAERHVHDHPWPFASFVLRGSYTEMFTRYPQSVSRQVSKGCAFHYGRPVQSCPSCRAASGNERVDVRVWRRWSLHSFRTSSAHRIIHVEPGTVTLVFVGKPIDREWGFWTEDGHVPWQEYRDHWDVLQGSVS